MEEQMPIQNNENDEEIKMTRSSWRVTALIVLLLLLVVGGGVGYLRYRKLVASEQKVTELENILTTERQQSRADTELAQTLTTELVRCQEYVRAEEGSFDEFRYCQRLLDQFAEPAGEEN